MKGILKLDFNFKVAETISHEGLRTFSTEQKINEIDIVLVCANYEKAEEFHNVFISNGDVHNVFNLTANLVSHTKGFFVAFLGNNCFNSLQRFIPYLTISDLKFKINRTPHSFKKYEYYPKTLEFLEENFSKTKKYYSISMTRNSVLQVRDVLVDDVNNSYINIVQDNNRSLANFGIILPLYESLSDKVGSILNVVIPEFNPELIPPQESNDWLYENEFLPGRVTSLIKDIQIIKKERDREIELKKEEVNKVLSSEAYMLELLTSKDEVLQNASGIALSKLFEKLGISYKIMDVDKEDDKKDDDPRRKEDFRVTTDEKDILVDVSGADGNFSNGILNKMSKHRRTYQRLHPESKIENVFSLAILNHDIGMKPSERSKLFGSIQDEIKERLKDEELTVIKSSDLFYILKDFDKLALNKEKIIKFLTEPGIKDVSDLMENTDESKVPVES